MIEDLLAPLLAAWMPRQRWYSTKNLVPRITALDVEEVGRADGVSILRAVVCDEAGGDPVVYQVPLTLRPGTADIPAAALVGRTTAGLVHDGCADPAYAAWLLGRTSPGLRLLAARVLSGEQSNTSIICDVADDDDGTTVIAKVFRVLADGSNPDIELQEALSRAGTLRVPRFLGSLRGSWRRGGSDENGELAVVQEFIAGAQDAWRVALECLRTGAPFDATSLGAATAEVHHLLATEFGTREAGERDRTDILGQWRERAAFAADAVPALSPLLGRATEVYRRAAGAAWPQLQRVHGDYHLGQVIHAPGRGWVLLDFEGEPLRPLAQRRLPDLALRDIAGMLRSFDYAAASAGGTVAESWAGSVRREFLDGYATAAGDPRDHAALLAALELDKALYEAVYESRNRPDWLRIPLAAVERMLL